MHTQVCLHSPISVFILGIVKLLRAYHWPQILSLLLHISTQMLLQCGVIDCRWQHQNQGYIINESREHIRSSHLRFDELLCALRGAE